MNYWRRHALVWLRLKQWDRLSNILKSTSKDWVFIMIYGLILFPFIFFIFHPFSFPSSFSISHFTSISHFISSSISFSSPVLSSSLILFSSSSPGSWYFATIFLSRHWDLNECTITSAIYPWHLIVCTEHFSKFTRGVKKKTKTTMNTSNTNSCAFIYLHALWLDFSMLLLIKRSTVSF